MQTSHKNLIRLKNLFTVTLSRIVSLELVSTKWRKLFPAPASESHLPGRLTKINKDGDVRKGGGTTPLFPLLMQLSQSVKQNNVTRKSAVKIFRQIKFLDIPHTQWSLNVLNISTEIKKKLYQKELFHISSIENKEALAHFTIKKYFGW